MLCAEVCWFQLICLRCISTSTQRPRSGMHSGSQHCRVCVSPGAYPAAEGTEQCFVASRGVMWQRKGAADPASSQEYAHTKPQCPSEACRGQAACSSPAFMALPALLPPGRSCGGHWCGISPQVQGCLEEACQQWPEAPSAALAFW